MKKTIITGRHPGKQVMFSIFGGLLIFLILAGVTVFGMSNYATGSEKNAIEDCKADNNPNKGTNCDDLKDEVKDLLESFGNKQKFPIYITGKNETFCGDNTVGCVQSLYNINDNIPPVMSISYSVKINSNGKLKHVVAHEYVHVLTNEKEEEWLRSSKLFSPKIDPVEAIADCGVFYFVKDTKNSDLKYINTCSAKQKKVAKKIIEDKLIK